MQTVTTQQTIIPSGHWGLTKAQWVAIGITVIATLFLGTLPILVRLSETAAVSTAAWRLLFGSVALGMMMGGGRQKKSAITMAQAETRPTVRDYGLLALLGIVFAIDMVLWNWAVLKTTVANATLLSNFAPLFVAMTSFLLFGKKLRGLFIFGLGVSLCGAILLSGDSFHIGGQQWLGDVYAMLSSLAIGVYYMMLKPLRRVFSARELMFGSSVVSAVALFAFIPFTDGMGVDVAVMPFSMQGWIILILLGISGQVLGQGLVAWAASRLPSVLITTLTLLQPVFATIFAWGLFNESLTLVSFGGICLVLVGLIISIIGQEKTA